MGIFSFIKNGAQEMFIARPDSAKNQIVWKHPDPTIPMKAQLTVMDDECAFFFKDGHLVGKVDGGQRITMETSNIPFLDQLIDKFTGGNMWKAEVWFVTLREMAGFKFGGRIGMVKDPDSGLAVETMVHGDFSIRVSDPVKAIQFFGTRQMHSDEEYEGFFREQVLKVVRDRIAELMVKKRWPLLDVTSGAFTEEIEEEVLEGTKKHLDRYGVMTVSIANFEVRISDKDQEDLRGFSKDFAYADRAAKTNMQGYQQFAAGKAMMGAGEGMAKGGGAGGGNPMLAGAGLGVGFGMAQMFQQQQQPPQYQQQQPQYQQPPAAPAQGLVACAACGQQVAPGKFCAECGKELAPPAPAKAFCSNCGAQQAAGTKFCSGCGNKMA